MSKGRVSIFQIYLAFYFLICVRFFIKGNYILGVYYSDVINVGILTVTLFFYFVNPVRLNKVMDSLLFLHRDVMFFIALVLLEFVYSKFLHGESWLSSLEAGYFYLIIIAVFLLENMVCSPTKLEQLEIGLLKFNVFNRIITLFTMFMGRTMKFDAFLMFLCLPIAIAYIKSHKKVRLAWMSVVLTGLSVFLAKTTVGNTITYVIFLVTTIGFWMVLKLEKWVRNTFGIGKTPTVLIIILSVVCIAFVMGTNIIQNLAYQDVGVAVRLDAIAYYNKQLIEHPFLGMGFIDGSASESLYRLLHGINNYGFSQYYREDLGIIGFANEFGLVGTALFLHMLFRILKAAILCEGKEKYMILGIFLLVVAQCISLFPLNKGLIHAYVLMVVIVEKNYEFAPYKE